jgi:hypothetical protein
LFSVGREYSRHETPEEISGKKEEMIAQGKIVEVTKRKRQGTGAHEEFRFDHARLDAISEVTQVIHYKWFEGNAQFHLYLILNSAKLAWTL